MAEKSSAQLADESGIGVSTVSRIRMGKPVTAANKKSLIGALDRVVEFAEGGWVRYRPHPKT